MQNSSMTEQELLTDLLQSERAAVKQYADYISSQVLATSIQVVAAGSLADAVELDMDDYVVKASIKK